MSRLVRRRRHPFDDAVLAAKRGAAIPHEFVLDAVGPLAPVTRPMFGCLAVYVEDRIVLILRDKPRSPADNGVWLATRREHHESLRREFPRMRSIRVFGKEPTQWQVLPADDPDFEEAALRACRLILARDPRIGRVPKTGSRHAPDRRRTRRPAHARLELTRAQILAFRRRVGALDRRLPMTTSSLRRAAWAGLQDSMPRAALLSIHARVDGVRPRTWEHPSLAQLWGPRFNNYVVASKDLAVFSLGRLPDDPRRRARAYDTADRLRAVLAGERLPFSQAARRMGVPHNSLRYAAATGGLLMRWDGARQPDIWTAPAPAVEPRRARLELARRYLHIFGPATMESFADWAGIQPSEAHTALETLTSELLPARTPLGDSWILAGDEASFRAPPDLPAAARLLPSGDAYSLLWGADRKLLVPEARRRAALWTSRVWPGALLVNGEIAGIWRRSAAAVSIEPWRRLSVAERAAAEAEAVSLPLPGVASPISVRWA